MEQQFFKSLQFQFILFTHGLFQYMMKYPNIEIFVPKPKYRDFDALISNMTPILPIVVEHFPVGCP